MLTEKRKLRSLWQLGCVLFIATGLNACSQKNHSALGTLERDRVLLTATANEIIVQVYTREGAQVQQGDPLLQLSNTRQQAVVARAQAEAARAEAALLKLTNGERPEDIASAQAEVNRAQAAFEQADTNFRRLDKLVSEKLVSDSDRDLAKAQRDETRAKLASAREQYNKLAGGARHEDIVQAQAALAAARAEHALQAENLNDLTIVATRAGKLDSLPFNLGERVNQGAVLAAIQADAAPYARVYVPEPLRASLTLGDQRAVIVDGKQQIYKGKLRWIATEPSFTPYYALNESDRARLMYLAEFDLLEGADKLPTGVPVSVELAGE